MERPVIAKGKRVRLVPITEEDVDWLWRNVNERETFLLMGRYGFVSKEDERGFVKASYHPDKPRLLILNENNERMGVIGINEADRYDGTAEVGYWLAKGFRGKGYGKEALCVFVEYAFKELNYRRLYAYTQEDNFPSQRTLESCGFKREGVLRKHVYRPHLGKYVDSIVYGLLREEWEKR